MSTFENNDGPVLFRSGSMQEKIRAARKLGYDGVDLFSDVTDIEEAFRLGQQFKNENLEIPLMVAATLAGKGVNLTNPDEEARKKSIEEYQKQIDIAAAMNAQAMPVGYLRGNRQKGVTEPEYEKCLAESMKILGAYAAGKNIQLWLEPINRYEMNTMNSAVKTLEFMKRYSIEAMKLLIDAFHMNIEDNGIEQAIEACKGFIGHVHLPDNQRYACGSGSFDFTSILGALKNAGFGGYVSVEAFPIFGEYESAKMSIETLKAAMDKL